MPRFMRKGTTRFYFVPTIASALLVPTTAEIAAGTRLDPQLAEINGFNFANSPIATPDMESTFTKQIPGEDTAADSSLTFYELRDEANPIKTAQPKGAEGFIVIFFEGIAGANPAAGDDADVWPVIVSSNSRAYSAGNEAAQYTVTYAITDEPKDSVSIT